MCEMLKELEPYIDERIQSNFKKLRNSEEYCSKNKKFSEKYKYLFNVLKDKDKTILEDSYAILNDINAKENYLAYQIGFVDGIKLNDYIERNRN